MVSLFCPRSTIAQPELEEAMQRALLQPLLGSSPGQPSAPLRKQSSRLSRQPSLFCRCQALPTPSPGPSSPGAPSSLPGSVSATPEKQKGQKASLLGPTPAALTYDTLTADGPEPPVICVANGSDQVSCYVDPGAAPSVSLSSASLQSLDDILAEPDTLLGKMQQALLMASPFAFW